MGKVFSRKLTVTADDYHTTALAAMAHIAWGHPNHAVRRFAERHGHRVEPPSTPPGFSSVSAEQPLLLSALAA